MTKMPCVEKPVQHELWASERDRTLGKEIKLHSEAIVSWFEGQTLEKSV